MGLQIEAGIDHRAQGLRILFAGKTHQVYRGFQSAIVESLQQAPVADARAVLITRFNVEVAVAMAGGDRYIGHSNLGAIVAVQYAKFAAFLVVDAEIDRNAGFTRPHHGGWLISVTDKIPAGTGFVIHQGSIKLSGLLNSKDSIVNDPVDRLRRRMSAWHGRVTGSWILWHRSRHERTDRHPRAKGRFIRRHRCVSTMSTDDLVKIVDKLEQAGGEIVTLAGRVLDVSGNPIPGARIEIWQCDVNGRYLHRADQGAIARDAGFQGFGHDISGADGSYAFRTIKPVPYAGRTPHIHVKVLVDGRERLTTQFYLRIIPLMRATGCIGACP